MKKLKLIYIKLRNRIVGIDISSYRPENDTEQTLIRFHDTDKALTKAESEINRTDILIKKEQELAKNISELSEKKAALKKLKEEAQLRKLELKAAALLNAKAKLEETQKEKLQKKHDLSRWQDNVYLRGRAAWNDMYGSVVERNRQYLCACILLSFALILTIIGITYIGSQSKIKPYVVQLGKNGEIVDVGSASKSPEITDKIIKYSLEQFIINIRSISGDNIIEKSMLAKAYASVNTANNANALNMVRSYIQANNPFQINSQFTRQVNIQSIFPVSKDTYQVSWEETQRRIDGKLVNQSFFTGQFSYKLSPSTEENFQYNPFGIYITNISWSEIQIDNSINS